MFVVFHSILFHFSQLSCKWQLHIYNLCNIFVLSFSLFLSLVRREWVSRRVQGVTSTNLPMLGTLCHICVWSWRMWWPLLTDKTQTQVIRSRRHVIRCLPKAGFWKAGVYATLSTFTLLDCLLRPGGPLYQPIPPSPHSLSLSLSLSLSRLGGTIFSSCVPWRRIESSMQGDKCCLWLCCCLDHNDFLVLFT